MTGSPEARTTGGPVTGSSVATPSGIVERYLGIPFAEPPVGPRRFRPPEPVRPWRTARDATAFGPAPLQTAGQLGVVVPGGDVGATGEDCLTLNVWAPAERGEPLPVVVWLYGGAFQTGAASSPTYEASRLAAEQGLVVVSANYRLGALGFLDLRAFGGERVGAATNAGLLDQLLALAWVADNAAAFGGDPARITLLGESAGAGSIVHLLSSPRCPPVRRAVACSPGVDFTLTADLAATTTARVLHHAGASSAAELVALPAGALLDAQARATTDLLFSVGTMPFHPVLDGELLPVAPSAAFAAGAAAAVDLVIGSTTDELRLFPDPRADRLDDDGLARWVAGLLTARLGGEPPAGAAAALVARYRGRATPSRSGGADLWAALSTDGTMRLPIERLTAEQAAHNPRTFAYEMAWSARRTDRDVGAFHAIDLPFLFDAFTVDGWGEFLGADSSALALGRAMRDALGAFAATGDPSTAELGTWPAYDATRRATMRFDHATAVVDDPLAEVRSWWAGLWSPRCRPAPVPL